MFISSKNYENRISTILQERGECCAAVAFWGHGADKLIAARRGQPTKLICNLRSGGTNPNVVLALRLLPGVEIRQHDTLHAKVVIGGNSALVGSANFSCNGLNREGEESGSWQEAGLVTSDSKEIEKIKQWFCETWNDSRPIKDHDIEWAIKIWRERRATRLPGAPRRAFCLKELTRPELQDRNIFLAICRDYLSPEAEKAYQTHKESLTSQANPTDDEPPMFEDWPELPKDSILIDFYYGTRGGVHCDGLATRTNDLKFDRPGQKNGHLAICRRVDYLMGAKFSSTSFAKEIRPYIEEIWGSEKAVGDDLGRYIDLVDVWDICCDSI